VNAFLALAGLGWWRWWMMGRGPSWRFVIALCFLAICLASARAAEPDREKAERYLERAIAETARQKAFLLDDVARTKQKIRATDDAGEKRDLKKYLGKLTKTLANLKAGQRFEPELDFPLTVGAIGQLTGGGMEALKVIDAKKVIVKGYYSDRTSTPGEEKRLPCRFVVRGIDTKSMSDRNEVKLPGAYEVVGNEPTEFGTLQVIEPFDISAAEAYLKSLGKPKPAKKK
jgi:hypothetical protein